MDIKKAVRIRLTTTIALTGAGRIPATRPKELRRLPEHLQSQAEAHQDVVSPLANLLVLPAQPAVMIWGGTVVKVPDGGRQAAFNQKLLEAIGPQQAVVFAEQDDRYRDLAAGVEEAWKAQVGAAGWHRTDLEGTVSIASDGERIVVEK